VPEAGEGLARRAARKNERPGPARDFLNQGSGKRLGLGDVVGEDPRLRQVALKQLDAGGVSLDH